MMGLGMPRGREGMCLQHPHGPQTPSFLQRDGGPISGLPGLVGPTSLSPSDGTLQQEESKPESSKHLPKERRAALHQVHSHLP